MDFSRVLPFFNPCRAEFYEKEKLLPMAQLELLVVFLRRLLYRLAWSDFAAFNAGGGAGLAPLLDLRVAAIQVQRPAQDAFPTRAAVLACIMPCVLLFFQSAL
jgi:hypothetical protein